MIRYRNFDISFYAPPIPDRSSDWQWVHADYDGPEDNRAGHAASEAEARAAVDEWIAENFSCRCSAAVPDDCMALTCKWRRP